MRDGTRFTSAGMTLVPKHKLALILGGAAVAILVAGVLLQILRGERSAAGEERANPGSGAKAGTARVGSRARPRYLASVNGERITYDEVAGECVARYGKEVLDNIINRTIIQQACKKRGIQVSPAEAHAEIVKIAGRFKLDVDQWYQMLQAERGISPMQYRRDVIWPMLALKKLAGETVTVTEGEVQRAFVTDYGEKVKARMIMLDNFRRAQKVWNEAVKNPENFERLARKDSIDPNSRALGGQIPPIRQYTGNKNLTEAAFKLRKGEVSAIIELGGNRYVILKCEGRTEQVVKDIEDVREDLYERLMEEKRQQSVAKVFERLKEQTTVDNYLTNTRSEGIQQTSGRNTGHVRPAGETRSVNRTRSHGGERPTARRAGPTRTGSGNPPRTPSRK